VPPSQEAARGRQNEAMPSANDTAAALLDEYADLMVMTGGDPFRARNYGKAARAIAAHAQDVSELSAAELLRIPGVGKSIAAKVAEITATGSFAELEHLRADADSGARSAPCPAALPGAEREHAGAAEGGDRRRPAQ